MEANEMFIRPNVFTLDYNEEFQNVFFNLIPVIDWDRDLCFLLGA